VGKRQMKWERIKFSGSGQSLPIALGLLLVSGAVCSAAVETYDFLVFSGAAAGHEDEYNKWYNEQHALDVVAVPGFVSAQRFVQNDVAMFAKDDKKEPKYVVIYKIVTDNIDAVFAEVARRIQAKETIVRTDLFEPKTSNTYVYKYFRPELKGPGGEAPGAIPGPKQTYLQIVFTGMVEGKDDEFNDYYDNHHGPELVGEAGFVSAQRMILVHPANNRENNSTPGSKYLAVFRIETSDIAAVKKNVLRPGHPPGATSEAADRNATRGYTFRAIGPEISGDKVRADRAAAKAKAGK
jgi:hypothetical protein